MRLPGGPHEADLLVLLLQLLVLEQAGGEAGGVEVIAWDAELGVGVARQLVAEAQVTGATCLAKSA